MLCTMALESIATLLGQQPQLAPRQSHLQPKQLINALRQLHKLCDAGERGPSAVGQFEWLDGVLLTALEQGEWLLLENVNFCEPSVLDRLNALLESDGSLLVNECGLVNGEPRLVKPHPDFRIFLTMDPQFGEVSRAMRNRCVEIALLPNERRDEGGAVLSSKRDATNGQLMPLLQPLPRDKGMLLASAGLHGVSLSLVAFISHMHDYYSELSLKARENSHRTVTVRHMQQWGYAVTRHAEDHVSCGHLLWQTFCKAYAVTESGSNIALKQHFEAEWNRLCSSTTPLMLLHAPGILPRCGRSTRHQFCSLQHHHASY